MRYIPLLLSFLCITGHCQDPARLHEEVIAIQKKYDSVWDPTKETIVFTGSSSIRFWEDLPNLFPDVQIVNSGFGGSQASDLLVYINELILRYKPKKVFIYEGDNDINDAKKPSGIINVTGDIIAKIKAMDKTTSIVLISAKPSIARWHLRPRYRNLNRKLRRLSKKDKSVDYADVWNTMLQGRKLKEELFLEDGLHMNAQGYRLWYSVLAQYMK